MKLASFAVAIVLLDASIGSAQSDPPEAPRFWRLVQEQVQDNVTTRSCSRIAFRQDGTALVGDPDGGVAGILPPSIGITFDPTCHKRECRMEHGKDASRIQMSCSCGEAVVRFSAEGSWTAQRFSGTWKATGIAGTFVLERSDQECSADVQYIMDDVLICQEPAPVLDPRLWSKVKDRASVREVVQKLGPGLCRSDSSTGSIWWNFKDGRGIATGIWPMSLNHRVRVLKPGRSSLKAFTVDY